MILRAQEWDTLAELLGRQEEAFAQGGDPGSVILAHAARELVLALRTRLFGIAPTDPHNNRFSGA
jgi:hypothetical protein